MDAAWCWLQEGSTLRVIYVVLPVAFQVGIIGAGRIGAAYARMMVEGHKMNLVYYDPYPNTRLEEYIKK
jgi:lactate dehydrogenase-like 2-hydroxyacid dehydrogenase